MESTYCEALGGFKGYSQPKLDKGKREYIRQIERRADIMVDPRKYACADTTTPKKVNFY